MNFFKRTIQQLREHGRFHLSMLLAAMSIFCLGLSVFRYWITDSTMFLFLNWNLFLAFIPWLASTVMMISPKLYGRKMVVLPVLGAWLLFFPNSPYILTDLFHLRHKSSVPIWFDLTLVLSFAWTGLIYGFVSLLDIEKMLRKNYGKNLTAISITLLLFIGSFGIYLGRYLRWNSWDIIQNPMGLLYDITERFAKPFEHPRTWGLTILMGLLLNMMYWSIKLLKRGYNGTNRPFEANSITL